ncbi:MAG TPA: diguanylate cyclase [Lichenihabitans sp.]|nr:diguanylate cyclase [Lichenihabitans sp.]
MVERFLSVIRRRLTIALLARKVRRRFVRRQTIYWSVAAAVLVGGGIALNLLRPDPVDTLVGDDAVLIALGCLCGACIAAVGRRIAPPVLLGGPILWTGLCAIRPVLADPALRLGLAGMAGLLPAGATAIQLRRSFRRADVAPGRSTPESDTCLGDRQAFETQLATAFSSAQREGADIALIVLGFEGGSSEADGPAPAGVDLAMVARVLRGGLYRPVDLAYHRGEAEFAVLLPGTGVAAARIVADRIERGLRHRIAPAGDEVAPASISLGLAAMRPAPTDNPASLLGRADAARAAIMLNALPRPRPPGPGARSAASPRPGPRTGPSAPGRRRRAT